MLTPVATFNFASRFQMHRITADRNRMILPKPEDLKLCLPKSHGEKPKKATV
jgi:hypothetical protein